MSAEHEMWLASFKKPDQPIAFRLLEILVTHPTHRILDCLEKAILKTGKTIDGPIALVPVIGDVAGHAYFINEKEKPYARPPNYSYEKMSLVDKNHPFAVEKRFHKLQEMGSEGQIGSLITNITRSQSTKFFQPRSLLQLIKKRCRAVFLIDDIMGTGKTASEFYNCFLNNKTLPAWLSYGHLTIHYVSYCADPRSIPYFRSRTNKRLEIVVCTEATTLDAVAMSSAEKRVLLKLCTDYAPRKKFALGFRRPSKKRNPRWSINQTILDVLGHSVPNNTPGILWDTYNGWQPLYPKRGVSRKTFAYQNYLDRQRRERLLAERKLDHLSGIRLENRSVFVVLDLISREIPKRAFAQMSGLTNEELVSALDICRKSGFLDTGFRIRSAGKIELIRIKGGLRKSVKEFIDTTQRPYYPSQLRGVVAN